MRFSLPILHHPFITALEALSDTTLFLPYYHVVSDEVLPHISHLYPYKNKRQFIADLDFLARRYHPISLEDLIDAVKSRKVLKKGTFIITFDDGYNEIDSVAAPILYRKGIPAIFFLTTDLIDNKVLSHDNKASLIIDFLREDAKRRPSSKLHVPSLPAGRFELTADWIRALRRREPAKLDEIAASIGVDFKEFLRRTRPYLDAVQIQALINHGFYFGAHSYSHPYFRDLSLAEQLKQALGSVQVLRNRFKLPYSVFAFPHDDQMVGRDFFRITEKSLDLTFGTNGLQQGVIATNLQRVNFEKSLKPAHRILLRKLVKNVISGRCRPRLLNSCKRQS